MKAAVLYGKEDVRIEDVPERALAPGEVRVRIEAALTCGTDLKVFKRGHHARMLTPPCVFGHELAGVIVETSPLRPPELHSRACESADAVAAEHRAFASAATAEASREMWRVGDRVVAANSAPCGECFSCAAGQENLCDDLLFLNGAYAESIVIPARLVAKNLLRLRPETSFRAAALTEPLACVVQGIADLRLQSGERVLVIGAGPIGLMAVALAKHRGCEVTVAGRGESRLAAASRLGAAAVVDMSGQDDVELAAKTQIPGGRFDVVFEAVGKPETWTAAVQLVRKGGRVNLFGGCPSGTTVTFDTARLHYANLTLLASFHHTPRTIRRALELIETGVISAEDFVTGEAGLSELPQLFQAMAADNQAVKTFVDVRR